MTQHSFDRRRFLKVALVGGSTIALAACGNSDEGAKADDSQAKSDGSQDSSASSDKTLKVVCTNESYKELFDAFTKDKGMPVEFISMSSGEVLSKIKAEDGKPSADLWFGGGIDSFMAANEEGLLQQVNFPDADKFAEGFKDPDNHWFSKGVTVVGFIVNNDILADKSLPKPAAWTDLANTEYKDEIIMSSPAVSGTNYAAVAGILQSMGEEKGWEYLTALNANIPFYTKRGSDPSTRVSQGEMAVGITYLDQTLNDLLANGSCALVYPTDGMPYIPDGVAAFAGAENVQGAEEFIEWLFSSDENLKLLATIDKKNTLELCIPSLDLPLEYNDSNLMKEDIAQFGTMRDSVLEKWDEITKGKEIQGGDSK